MEVFLLLGILCGLVGVLYLIMEASYIREHISLPDDAGGRWLLVALLLLLLGSVALFVSVILV